MKNRWALLGAVLMTLLLWCFPDPARTAALDSLSTWFYSVVPGLFPFFVLLPALTCPEAAQIYERMLGRAMRPLFGLSGRTAAALGISLLSGSPAGAAALARLDADQPFSPDEALRAALLCSGCNPLFLTGAVASGFLGRPDLGWVLVISQILALITSGMLLRRVGKGKSLPARSPAPSAQPTPAIKGAVLQILGIGGCMVFFGVIARLAALCAALLLPNVNLETPLICFLELGGGCASLCALPMSDGLRIPLLSAVIGFSGLSICIQSLGYLKPMGVRARDFLLGKALHALLCAGFSFLIMHLKMPAAPAFAPISAGSPDATLFFAVLSAGCLLLPPLLGRIFSWRETR